MKIRTFHHIIPFSLTITFTCLLWSFSAASQVVWQIGKFKHPQSEFNTDWPAWPSGAKQFRFHMIGNAHIDPVFLWQWSEGVSVVHSTFRSALDHMREDPDFKFTASSAQFYAWVAENDPAMLAEIRERVDEGRWALVGGWWVEPDVNIPSGESLVRQGLYAQLLFRRLFGRMATVGYNPDSFGHPGTLPQILNLEGMHDYVFMRPEAREKKLPADVFWWESPDGSRVLAFHIPFSYSDTGSVEKGLHQNLATLHEPVRTLMYFYGVGDHGGGATKLNLESIHKVQAEPGAPTLLFSTPETYFSEIRKMPDLNLPVVQDDLQHHGVGCYTAESQVKKDNRASELLLMTAEKLASLASVVYDFPYPKGELTAAWKNVLFLQFHDSLAGTSVPEHYLYARNAYGYAMAAAEQAITLAAQKIAWEIPAQDPDSQYLVVFNPHAWDATLNVEYDLEWPGRGMPGQAPQLPEPSILEDDSRNPLPHQWTQGSSVQEVTRRKLVFRAPVPAFGYRQFRIRRAVQFPNPPGMIRASEKELENEHLRVSFTADGSFTIFDKDNQVELFQPGKTGARAVVLNDPSDTWGHEVTEYADEIGAFGAASFRVLERGPLRAVLRARSSYGDSRLRIDWILYAESRNLEARVQLDWHEHRKMLKFSFPVNVERPIPTYEIAYGTMRRLANGREDPGQRWIDVTGERGGHAYGLAIINDAKYGYSVQGNDLRISIARAAIYAQSPASNIAPDTEYIWQDQGMQTFRLLMEPHTSSWQDAGVARLADEFSVLVPVIYQGIHNGSQPQSASFLSVDTPDVIVSVVKQAETNGDLIVRCYETAGHPTRVTLTLGLVNKKWTGNFRPFEIKTLRVAIRSGEIREVNALEE
jgi:alpha-mannosidase